MREKISPEELAFLANLDRLSIHHLRATRDEGGIVVRNILGEEGPGGPHLDMVVDQSGDVTLAIMNPDGRQLGSIRFVNRAGGMVTVAHKLHELAKLLYEMKETSNTGHNL